VVGVVEESEAASDGLRELLEIDEVRKSLIVPRVRMSSVVMERGLDLGFGFGWIVIVVVDGMSEDRLKGLRMLV